MSPNGDSKIHPTPEELLPGTGGGNFILSFFLVGFFFLNLRMVLRVCNTLDSFRRVKMSEFIFVCLRSNPE